MAKRINAITTTATSPASDDYVPIDGTTNNTRKILASNFIGPKDRNGLAPRGGVVLDGTNTTRIYAPLGAYSAGTDPFSISCVTSVPSPNASGNEGIVSLSSDATAGNVARSLTWYWDAGTSNIRVVLRGATSNDYILWDFTGFSSFAGKMVHLTLVRASGDTTPVLYVNGTLWTTITGPVITGTSPGWQGSITSTYANVGFWSASNVSRQRISSVAVFNCALSAADVLEIYEAGGAVPFRYRDPGLGTELVTNQSFTTDLSGWTTGFGSPVRDTGVDSYDGASLNLNGSSSYNTLSASIPNGKAARVTFYAKKAAAGNIDVGVSGNDFAFGTLAVTTSWAQYSISSVATSSISTLLFGTRWAGGNAWIDLVSIKRIGAVVSLPLTDGAGFQFRDESTNKLHGLGTTTGVTHLLPSSGPLRLRYTSDGTSTAQKLCGGTTLPANSQILRVRARSQSGTPNLILGTASGGSQVVASVALSTTWKVLTIALTDGFLASNTDLWMTASTANVVELDIAWEPLTA